MKYLASLFTLIFLCSGASASIWEIETVSGQVEARLIDEPWIELGQSIVRLEITAKCADGAVFWVTAPESIHSLDWVVFRRNEFGRPIAVGQVETLDQIPIGAVSHIGPVVDRDGQPTALAIIGMNHLVVQLRQYEACGL